MRLAIERDIRVSLRATARQAAKIMLFLRSDDAPDLRGGMTFIKSRRPALSVK